MLGYLRDAPQRTKPIRIRTDTLMATFVLLAMLLLSLCGTGQAAVRLVPGEYTTIQQAIDLSAPDDTVVVSAGTYQEDLQITAGIVLLSQGALNGTATPDVVLDAGGFLNAITLSTTSPSVISLRGFRLTGSLSTALRSLWPSVCEFRFTDGMIDQCPGGMSLDHTGITIIERSTFEYLTSQALAINFSDVVVRDCEFSRCLVFAYLGSSGLADFTRCSFRYNQGLMGSQILSLHNSNITLDHCVIQGCYAGTSTNSLIEMGMGAQVDLRNTIIYGNSLGAYNDLIALNSSGGTPCTLTINYSNIQGGTSSIRNERPGDIVSWGEGNLVQDPLFVNGLELAPGSPCIDAGDPLDPPDPDGTRTDMGLHYHCQGEAALLPEAVAWVTEPGHPLTREFVMQSACSPVRIDSVRFGGGPFMLLDSPATIPGGYHSAGFVVEFDPAATGFFADTLHIWADTQVSNTDDPRHHRVALNGESGPIPLPVTDLAITLLPDRSIRLHWSPVTSTVHGNPVDPTLYLVFFNDGNPHQESDWHYLTATPQTEATHFRAARFTTRVCYQVLAWVGPEEELRSIAGNPDRRDTLQLLNSYH